MEREILRTAKDLLLQASKLGKKKIWIVAE